MTWNSPPSPASGGQGLRPPGRLQAPLTFSRDPFEGQKFDGVGGVVAPSVGGTGCADPVLAPACPSVPRNPQPWSYSKPSSLGSFGVGGPLPNKCSEHEGTSPFPWSLGSRSAFLFLAVRAEGRAGARAAPLGSAQTQGTSGPASGPGIPHSAARTAVVSRLREKGLQEGTDCPLGPAALAQAAPRVRSGTFLASGGGGRFKASHHRHDFRSSIKDPGEFLLSLKGITRIAETWLSGSGRKSTS